MRLIDADNLKEDLNQKVLGDCRYGEKIKSFLQWVIDRSIDNQPTIEPVNHGEWINTYGDTPHDPRDKNYWWHCSECGHSVSTSFKSNFCPHCGAKMDGEK